jgi:predicted AAA+ superfamily ATPase
LLENVVYFELLRRRNFIHIGKNNDAEIDFVARNMDTDDTVYYQVAYTAKDQETLGREMRPLDSINDHRQKILLTTDLHEFEEKGIKHINVAKWLLDEKSQ